MGSAKLAVIHCEPKIGWQAPFAKKMADGLKALGINTVFSASRVRHDEGFPILLGTTFWKAIETPPYLLVDRCSFGDTNQWVSLVWNGHGGRGDHRVPESASAERWEKMGIGLAPMQSGEQRVLCGQHLPYSPHFLNIEDWYASVDADWFRPHPSFDNRPHAMPIKTDFNDATAVVLNSSVGIDALIAGHPVESHDEGFMGYGRSREELFPWLAWTQWHHDEISQGEPIRHLFDGI